MYNEIISPAFAKDKYSPIFLSELLSTAEKRGYTKDQFNQTVEWYESVGVLEYVDDKKEAIKMGM